jgi:hypothetical protein
MKKLLVFALVFVIVAGTAACLPLWPRSLSLPMAAATVAASGVGGDAPGLTRAEC